MLSLTDKNTFPRLNFSRCNSEKHEILVVTTRKLEYHEPAGYLSRLRLIVENNQAFKIQVTILTTSQRLYNLKNSHAGVCLLLSLYSIQVLLQTTEEGEINSINTFHDTCYRLLSTEYKFCPGLKVSEYNRYKSKIRYDPSYVHITEEPIKRIESTDCKRWFKIPRNAPREEKAATDVLCSCCKKMRNNLARSKKREEAVSPGRKLRRLNPSSHFNSKYLSPQSQKKRQENVRVERKKDKKLLRKYAPHEVILDDQQNDELSKLVSTIDNDGKQSLQDVLDEAQEHNASKAVKEAWDLDVVRLKERKQFVSDQQYNSE